MGQGNALQRSAARESVRAYSSDTVRNGNGGQAGAGGKGIAIDSGQILRQLHIGQPGASCKGSCFDSGDTVWKRNTLQRGIVAESAESNCGDTFRNGDFTQIFAAIECTFADAGQTLRQMYTGQGGAVVKGPLSDAGDTVGDRNTAQCRARRKSRSADAGNVLRQRKAGQIGAARESVAANACHTIGQNDSGDALPVGVPGRRVRIAVVIRHGAGAGYGQGAVGFQNPGQVFSAGAVVDQLLGGRLNGFGCRDEFFIGRSILSPGGNRDQRNRQKQGKEKGQKALVQFHDTYSPSVNIHNHCTIFLPLLQETFPKYAKNRRKTSSSGIFLTHCIRFGRCCSGSCRWNWRSPRRSFWEKTAGWGRGSG